MLLPSHSCEYEGTVNLAHVFLPALNWQTEDPNSLHFHLEA